MRTTEPLTVGVEEELHVLDAATGALVPDAPAVLGRLGGGEEAEGELHDSMVETGTPVCHDLVQVRDALTRRRAGLARAAAASGHAVIAAGTPPLADLGATTIADGDRYQAIRQRFGLLVEEQLVCGAHVHVGVDDRDLAVRALGHLRPWLPVLLALSASSPFWAGEDTGYASWRAQVWGRWPITGSPPAGLADAAAYEALLDRLVEAEILVDRRNAYWDARPSELQPTLEIRVADVCSTLDEAVLHTGLARALATTALAAAEQGRIPEEVPEALLAAARWRASRVGLEGALLDPRSWRPSPAWDVVGALVAHVRPALAAAGDADEVRRLLSQVRASGTSASRQRAAALRGGLDAVVAQLRVETLQGTGEEPNATAA